MNPQAIYHLSASEYCFPLSRNAVKLRLRTARDDGIEKVAVLYGAKYDFGRKRFRKEMIRKYRTSLFDYYETVLDLRDVRLSYVFEIRDGKETYYYSEAGLSRDYDFRNSFYDCFSYVINEADVVITNENLDEAVVYLIFVDRFRMGTSHKDKSYVNAEWTDEPTPRSFMGGDLWGVYEKLGYVKSLGTDIIYLTPIFKSPSSHKYDIEDYFKIDPEFGDEETLHKLIDKAHSLGMKVILDAVFNHASERLAQFQDVLKNKERSLYKDWFLFKDLAKLEYEHFSVCRYMPRLNTSNRELQDYLIGVARHYVEEFRVDGFRLDVSDEISHGFWRNFRRELSRIKPDIVLVGENWHDSRSFLQGDELHSVMNYAFTKACLDYFAWNKLDAQGMSDRLSEIYLRHPEAVDAMMVNLLDSHDTLRILTELKGDKDKLYCALALLYFYPGCALLYYGTEIDMEGGYDPGSRRGFDWSYKDKTTRELIRKLADLKHRLKGRARDLDISSAGDLLILTRSGGDAIYRLIINDSDKDIPFKFNEPLLGSDSARDLIKSHGFIIDMKEKGGSK